MNSGVSSLSSLPEDPTQVGKGMSVIMVLDINDNAPVFAINYETLLCENTMPGQVRPCNVSAVRPASLPFFSPPSSLMFTYKVSLLTLRATKNLSYSFKQVCCAHICLTA